MSKINELQQKIKENPNDYKLIEEYAIALSDMGENEEAYKNFMYLKNVMPENPIVYYNLGIILEKLKDFDTATQTYELALTFDENNLDIMFNLANLYVKQNRLDEAEELFLAIIEEDSEDENVLFYLGQIYSKKKEHDKAIEYLQKALVINPNDVIAKFYLAYEYKEISQVDLSIKTYEEVIKLSNDYSWAYYNLATIYLEQEDEEKALFYLDRTININPKDILAIKLASKIFVKHKKYIGAEKLLKKAVQEMPLEADLTYLLSQVYKELKNKANYFKFLTLTQENISTFTGNIDELNEQLSLIK